MRGVGRLFWGGSLVVTGAFGGGSRGLGGVAGRCAAVGRRVRRVGCRRHQGTGYHQQAADQQAVAPQPMAHRSGQHVGRGLGERHVGQGGRHHHVLVPGQGLGGTAGRSHEAQDGVVVAGVHDLALGAQHVHGQALGHGCSQIARADQPEGGHCGLVRGGRHVVADDPEGGQQPSVGGEIAGQAGVARHQGEDVVAELAVQERGGIRTLGPQNTQVLQQGIGQDGFAGRGGGRLDVVHGMGRFGAGVWGRSSTGGGPAGILCIS